METSRRRRFCISACNTPLNRQELSERNVMSGVKRQKVMTRPRGWSGCVGVLVVGALATLCGGWGNATAQTSSAPAPVVVLNGQDAPSAWSRVVGSQWMVDGVSAAVTVVNVVPAQPGQDRRDALFWLDACGVAEMSVTFSTPAVWVPGTGTETQCKANRRARTVLQGTPTFTSTGARWTLTRGKVRVFMRAAPRLNGTWSIATVQPTGEPSRSGVGYVTLDGNRAAFSDGCNRVDQAFVTGAGRFALVGSSRTTAKYCLPGTYTVADGSKLANAVFTVRTSGPNSMTLTSVTATVTLTR